MQFKGCVDQKGINGSPTMIIILIYALNKYLYVLCTMLDLFLREPDILEIISYRVSVSGPQP